MRIFRSPRAKAGRLSLLFSGIALAVALAVAFGAEQSAVRFAASPAYAALGQNPHRIADVAQKVLPSVVNIASTRKVRVSMNPFFRRFFGRRGAPPQHRVQRGQGSGVIISSDGVVVTNNHVVKNAQKVRVTLADKRSFEAKVLGTDPKSDLAVLKLKGASGLTPISVGDSAKLRLGDIVLAVGNPFGIGQTVTMGIVSAKGRGNVGIVDYEDFIQTDAAINPGNSGGALVNLRGELVGINTAILSRSGGYQGIGFAIPTNLAKPIVKSLRTTGKVVRGYIGVMIQGVSAEMAKAMRLPHSRGVLISDVVRGGPAARGGLRRGDFVVAIGATPTPTVAKLRNLVASVSNRKRLRFELWRKGKKTVVSVTTGRLGSSPVAGKAGKPGAPARVGRSGLTLAPLTSATQRRFRVPPQIRSGVVIERVAPGSKAARAGLRSGDVILEANRVKMSSVRRFTQVYKRSRGRVLLLVHRRGSTLFLLLPK
jgi:serine protease Do